MNVQFSSAAQLAFLRAAFLKLQQAPAAPSPIPSPPPQNLQTVEAGQQTTFPGEEQLTQGVLENVIHYLADDAREGRAAGGQHLENEVTAFLEEEFRTLGLKGLFPTGSPFQQPFIVDWQPAPAQADGTLPKPRMIHYDGKPYTKSSFRPELEAQLYALDAVPAELTKAAFRTHNLAAVIEGSDPALKGEYIVLCAHMDHQGINPLAEPGQDHIYNGADDNASGVAVVLAIARAVTAAKARGQGPKRSLLIVLFSAEEFGLLGSKFFVKNSPVPVEKIVGAVNLDMVGGQDAAHVAVLDSTADGKPCFFHDYHPLAADTGIKETAHEIEAFRERSDHDSFAKAGIPFIWIFEGLQPTALGGNGKDMLRPDYHGVNDEAWGIDYQKLLNVTRFTYRHVFPALNR